jgi:hypothetical protein
MNLRSPAYQIKQSDAPMVFFYDPSPMLLVNHLNQPEGKAPYPGSKTPSDSQCRVGKDPG